jgi:signal transduction histidine kinase
MFSRLRSLNLVARFVLVGATVGLMVGAGIAWYLDTELTELALRQTAQRAIDQVDLASRDGLDPADLTAPHTDEKRARLAARLAPLVEEVRRPDSGLVRMHLFAPDGTIVYSDEPNVVGLVVAPESAPLLAQALSGQVGAKRSGLTSQKTTRLRQRYAGALEVYVPIRSGGQVVGVYEVYHTLAPVDAIRPLVWTTVTAGFALLFAALLGVVLGAASLIRRQQEERLRLIERAAQADALRRADALKNELISVVSHELRTPLTSVVGFSELLMARGLDEAQREDFVQLLHQEGLRLTELLDEFLDLQRIESGRQQFAPVPTDLRQVVERAVASTRTDPTHPLVLDLPATLPPVLADADRIHQVLVNLLSNARKYSPDGGEVRVSAALRGGEVEVAVADRGLGIPPEALERLFERFFRVDTSDRRAIRGTGLGLAIVRQIVHAHGGRAWAESAGCGHGSRFVFTLPTATTSATPPPKPRGVELSPAMGVGR